MYKISEVSKLVDLTIPTLRYYEELGMIQPKRNKNGYREFSEQDLEWIQFIIRLKQTGMELSEIQKYARLRDLGDQTIEARMALLDAQEELLLSKKLEIEKHIHFLKEKQIGLSRHASEKKLIELFIF
ncbi:MerR family transcriptional regulator [Listeria sp. ILCC792]|uniref:MerR family transcriptional regulator n=1 Tax=Listeria sp. ILCC792 TaxID=1918331 RepID=UPI000B590FDB|nr:MerR family transcriptional regulator [Listeria sp. ILCC792]